MVDVEYEAVAWGSVGAEVPIEMQPGNPSTTLHPSAIPDHAAQSLLNCSNRRGVWELSDRCRQFAPSPIKPVMLSCASAVPTSVCVYDLSHPPLCGPWTGLAGPLTPCSSGAGIVSGASIGCQLSTPVT